MRYAARSDVGKVRAKNDDSAYAGRFLAVVADGMGGHAGGDVASASTVLDLIHLDRDGYEGDAGTHLADEIQTANSLLSELVHVNPKLAGMGTTVTALLLSGTKLEFAHIGDSRAYRLKNGVYEQISVDHTFVQRLIDEGRLHPSEAETHPHKNVLMRVLGDVDASPELDLSTFDAEPGERWLLCSDGLNYVRPTVVEDVVRSTNDLAECADKLIELTLEAGSPDNVSVVLFEVQESPAAKPSTARLSTVSVHLHPPLVAPGGEDDLDDDLEDDDVPATTVEASTSGRAITDITAAKGTATTGTVTSGSLADGTPAGGETPDPADNGEDLGAHLTAAVLRQELAERPHELVGAAVTALADGKIPPLEGRSAARRAAMVLTHKTETVKDGAASSEAAGTGTTSGRSRRLIASVIAAVVLMVMVIGLWWGFAWTQTRYYVGQSNGNVAIYNGVSQSLGPISLSHVYAETSLQVSSLPDFSKQQLAQTIPANNLEDARQIVSNLQLGSSQPSDCRTPGSSATAPPSASASGSTATPTDSAAPSASASPSASGSPSATATATPIPAHCPGGGK
ncbi:MAG: serine/threonine-protein phosphatase [Acidobacteria bacterium]|nr:serine/threonine-protein phosphatase [Acidobacteriota bacterium]